jgi:chemotaxis methyl-accepting protein methylase
VSGHRPQIYRLVEELIAQRTGVDIAGHLAGRVRGHVDGEVARLGLQGPDAFLARLEGDDESGRSLLDDLLAAVLVHETFFYRFQSQLDAFEASIIPELVDSGARGVRIWSAGCSQGPEPYTLAMLAARGTAGTGAGFEVLATDMCGAFLEEATSGIYRRDKLGELPADLRSRYMTRRAEGTYEVRDELRERVRFRRHNLLDPPPERSMHVISCRNVLMYLGPEGRRRAIENLASALSDDGFLLVGHSESLRDVPDLLGVDRRFALGIYRRSGSVPAPASIDPPRSRREPAAVAPAAAPAPEPAPVRAVSLIRLEGEYDADQRPEKLASLKESLGEAIDGEGDVVLEADGATLLDMSTAKLVARAARLVESSGRTLTVRTRKESVLRWAARHGLQVDSGPSAKEARQT